MATKNEITGDKIKSKPSNQAYLNGYDRVFNKKRKVAVKSIKRLKE